MGQWEILGNRRPIESLIADPRTEPDLRKRFELILELRAFAEDQLHLPVKRQYSSYVDLNREYVVWNVFAAPRFSLEAKSWWYPLVGKLTYRGFFDEDGARDYAAYLESDGWDVYVGGVAAYSTLGWFDDPVLNTFVRDEETRLASLLFHELAHQKLFIKGDTRFNEAFATAVAHAGTRRWLVASGKPDALREFQRRAARENRFLGWVRDTRVHLERLYESAGAADHGGDGEGGGKEARMAAEKRRILDEMRSRFQESLAADPGWRAYEEWFARPINNARLNTITTYYQLVPAFEALLAREDDDLMSFYTAVRNLGSDSKENRHARLHSLVRPSEPEFESGPETEPELQTDDLAAGDGPPRRFTQRSADHQTWSD